MDDGIQLVYDEESGCFKEKQVPYMIIEIATKEEFEFLQKAIKFYKENYKYKRLIMERESYSGKWMPVCVRLPKNNDCVLISTTHNHFDDGSGDWDEVVYGYYDSDNREWRSLAMDGIYDVYENVVAWMQLPPPAKSENLSENLVELVESECD